MDGKTLSTRPSSRTSVSTRAESLRGRWSGRKGKEWHVCPRNLETFQWRNKDYLSVEDVKVGLTPPMLDKCPRRLQHLQFSGLTHFPNVPAILALATDLRTLTFNDVVLANYAPASAAPAPEPTPLSSLTALTFYGFGGLSVHELHLLDFLAGNFLFSALAQVALLSLRRDNWQSSSHNIYKPGVDGTVLSRFLNDNWSMLKGLQIDRTDVLLYSAIPKVVNIQLVHFACDISAKGFVKVLEGQLELQVLKIWNKNLRAPAMTDVVAAIRRCSETLREIRIRYNEKDTTDDPRRRLTPLLHDCAVYKNCRKLRKISVGLSCRPGPGDREFPECLRVRPGALLNAHALPASLRNISLRIDQILAKDMEAFAANFPSFKRLKTLIFVGRDEMRYRLKVPWVLTLTELPKIRYFRFEFCDLKDLKAILAVKDSLPGLADQIKLTIESCIYTTRSKKGK